MNPFTVNLLIVKPPLLTKSCWPFALPLACFSWETPRVMPRVASWITQLKEEQQSQIVPPLSSIPALLLLLLISQTRCTSGPQRRRSWEKEAGKSLERVGHCPAGTAEVPWYLKGSIFCAPFPLCITAPRYQSCLKSAMGHSMGSPKCCRTKQAPSLRKISLVFFQRRSTGEVQESGYPTRLIPLDWVRST